MTHICNPDDLTYPNYPAQGEGIYSTNAVLWPFPNEVIAPLLPRKLELAPQTLTGHDTHPVIMFFGSQANVRPDFIPFGGMSYNEFIIAIPFVQWRDAGEYPYRGPFAYMPRLFLDKVFATLLGYMYGYPKLLARIQGGNAYRVHDMLLDRPLIRGDFTPHGDQKPVSEFPHFAALRPIFEIPFVGKLDVTPYICSKMTFNLDDALIRSCESSVELQYEFLPGILPDTRVSQGLTHEPLGSFQLDVPWNLTLPFDCDCLECTS